jgi:hypothetical protein
MLASLLAMAAFATVADSNQIANPGFESGTTGWSFWARSSDSAQTVLRDTSLCHGGALCLEIRHWGAQDWGEWSTNSSVAASTGEVWQWSLWVRTDSLPGSAELDFETQDASGNALDWNASPTGVSTDTGWTHLVARISVPSCCATLLPRLTGYDWDESNATRA